MKSSTSLTVFTSITLSVVCNWVQLYSQEHGQAIYPYVSTGPVSTLPRIENSAVTEDVEKEIESHIQGLAELAEPDFGLGGLTRDGRLVFAPIGDFVTELKIKPIFKLKAMSRLVEIGPVALPFLLEHLEDGTPTKLVISEKLYGDKPQFTPAISFGKTLPINPANLIEQRFFDATPAHLRPTGTANFELESYRVKVGDVCMVLIGQIVGRDYFCVSGNHYNLTIISPVHQKKLRKGLVAIWSSENPRKKLFESLMLDFSTRGTANLDLVKDCDYDYWEFGQSFALSAATRLAFYFPTESKRFIVSRLDSLVDSNRYFHDSLHNGLNADEFIHRVSWSSDPEIQASLKRLGKRAMDTSVKAALQTSNILKRQRN